MWENCPFIVIPVNITIEFAYQYKSQFISSPFHTLSKRYVLFYCHQIYFQLNRLEKDLFTSENRLECVKFSFSLCLFSLIWMKKKRNSFLSNWKRKSSSSKLIRSMINVQNDVNPSDLHCRHHHHHASYVEMTSMKILLMMLDFEENIEEMLD